jgi:predicted HAD superfamily Cof-like phosphohydrolase
MIQDLINKLIEFNKAFDIPYNTEPTNLENKEVNLRFSLMFEENQEYHVGATKKDLVEIADALGDKLYILLGTIIAHGMQDVIVDVFNEIHRSNMTKLEPDGKVRRREDGKILKPETYERPNLKQFFEDESNS